MEMFISARVCVGSHIESRRFRLLVSCWSFSSPLLAVWPLVACSFVLHAFPSVHLYLHTSSHLHPAFLPPGPRHPLLPWFQLKQELITRCQASIFATFVHKYSIMLCFHSIVYEVWFPSTSTSNISCHIFTHFKTSSSAPVLAITSFQTIVLVLI